MAEITVTARLLRVDLFEDRATVVRVLTVPQAPGRYHLRVPGLSPLIREASLSFAERPGLLVESARVERLALRRQDADPQKAQSLAKDEESLRGQLARATAQATRAGQRQQRALNWADSARQWANLALLRQDDPRAWVGALREHTEEQLQAMDEAMVAGQEQERLHHEHQRISRNLALAREGRPTVEGQLFIQVLSEGGGELELRYTIPCAVWRPIHRATLRGGNLTWEVGAMAWNVTGEDWNDAPARFSTARPGDQPSPPSLGEDLVYSQSRSKQIQVEAREEVVQVAREGKARSTDEQLGVDDGGEVRVYESPRPLRLPSDGRPVTVALETWTSPAEARWQAFPEKDPHVALRSRQTNGSQRPLLAGPVQLFRESGAVGRGRIPLVPPGEPFELGWGSHDLVRVNRRQDIERSTTRIVGTQHHSFTVRLRVMNLGAEPSTVELRERLPVSEIKELKVGAPTATPAITGPDKDGFCRWTLTLGPREHKELTLKYTVEAPSSVSLPW